MTADDDAARKSRAEELRKQIGSLKHPHDDADAEPDAGIREKPQPGGGMSPRDFINEKMRESHEGEK
jgi:hypothetical protein